MMDIFQIHHSQRARRTASNPVSYSCAIERYSPHKYTGIAFWSSIAIGLVAVVLSVALN